MPKVENDDLCHDPWPFEPKINRLRQTVEDYCAKFQVIPIRVFVLSC